MSLSSFCWSLEGFTTKPLKISLSRRASTRRIAFYFNAFYCIASYCTAKQTITRSSRVSNLLASIPVQTHSNVKFGLKQLALFDLTLPHPLHFDRVFLVLPLLVTVQGFKTGLESLILYL